MKKPFASLLILAVLLTAARPPAAALGTFGRVASLDLAEPSFASVPFALPDAARAFAYVGDGGSPGKIAKLRLPALTLVAQAPLELSETLSGAVIDETGGFLYAVTFGAPSAVLQFRLSDLRRVNTLPLPGDGPALSVALDAEGGALYVGTAGAPGKVVKVRLSDFTRESALALSAGENNPSLAFLAAGFAYFTLDPDAPSGKHPRLVKVRLSDFTRASAVTVDALGFNPFLSGALDETGGLLYLANFGRVFKVRLSDLGIASVLSLNTANENSPMAAVLDKDGGALYLGAHGASLSRLIKIRLSDFTRQSSADGGPDGSFLRAGFLDASRGLLTFWNAENPSQSFRIRTADLQWIATLRDCNAAVRDPSGSYIYFAGGTFTGSGWVQRVRLSDFTADAALPTGGDALTAAAAAGDYAYFADGGSPARVYKVRLSDFSLVQTLTLGPGENGAGSLALDPSAGFAYVGTMTSPAAVVKVRLSDLSRAGAMTMATGENGLTTALVDPAGGFVYFATRTAPGRVIKIRLADFTRAASLTLDPDDAFPSGGVLDAARGYAYFATTYSLGKIVRVRLADLVRDAEVTLSSRQGALASGVLDAEGGFAYFAVGIIPAEIVKVRLSDFTRLGSIDLEENDGGVDGGIFDPATGNAYFGTALREPARIVKVAMPSAVNGAFPDDRGGTVLWPRPGARGEVRLDVPDNGLSAAVTVTLGAAANFPAGDSAVSLRPTGVGFEVAVTPGPQPVRGVGVTLTYQDAEFNGFDESRLVLARFDADAARWVPLPSRVDAASNSLSAVTSHFSVFQVMEAQPAALPVKIFPNPLRPLDGPSPMTIANLRAGSAVRIFSFSGRMVRELAASSAGLAVWDGKDAEGGDAASGVYFLRVETAGGNQTLKAAVQR